MANTNADLEEPLFLDEPLDLPPRPAPDTSDIDALFPSEEEEEAEDPPAPPVPQQRMFMPVVDALILIAAATSFALVLALLR